MYQYTPRAPVRIYPENRSGESVSIHETDLQTGQLFPHTKQAVWATGQQTAKFWDFYPTQGGNTANTQGGFFSPVECAHGGFMPGMRGLQHGENRNKRVVSLRTIEVPGNFCPILKLQEYETMNATISMGAPAQNPLQALARLLPSGKPTHFRPSHQPVIRRKNRKAHVSALVYKPSETGFIAYLHGAPVAWVVPGYSKGQRDHQPMQCSFVDVAYHHQTQRGVNLESADFDTLQQAFDFLQATFIQGGAA